MAALGHPSRVSAHSPTQQRVRNAHVVVARGARGGGRGAYELRLQVAHKLAPGPLRDPRLAGLAQCESTKRVATWPTRSVRLLAVPLRAGRSSCVLCLAVASCEAADPPPRRRRRRHHCHRRRQHRRRSPSPRCRPSPRHRHQFSSVIVAALKFAGCFTPPSLPAREACSGQGASVLWSRFPFSSSQLRDGGEDPVWKTLH